MKEKLLILTFSFYPYSTVSAFRTSRFAKYLPGYDIIPYVITAAQGGEELKTERAKPQIEREYPHVIYKRSLFSYRFDSPVNPAKFDPQTDRLCYVINYAMRLCKDILFSPDKHIHWSLLIIPAVCRLIRKEKITTLLVSGDPFSLFVTGLIAKKITGVQLLLDYRDPWVSNPSNQAQTFLRKWIVTKLQDQCLQAADHIFTVNEEIYDELPVDAAKKDIIPNGFDPDLFRNIKPAGIIPGINDDDFLFFYAGKLDIYTSRYNPMMMLRSFRAFRESDVRFSGSKLLVCGKMNRDTMDTIKEEILTENVVFLGERPIREVQQYAARADALIHSVYPDKIETILPMKIYEYIMHKKPIISINLDRGLVKELLAMTRSGFACNNDNPQQGASLMEKAFLTDKKEFTDQVDLEPLQKYNVELLTGNLADIIRKQQRNDDERPGI